MTPQRAAEVRRLRVDQGRTWRAIARLIHDSWRGDWDPPNDQAVGMELCQRAAELEGADFLAPPWN